MRKRPVGRPHSPHGTKIVESGVEDVVIRLLSDSTLDFRDAKRILGDEYDFDVSVPTLKDYKKNFLENLPAKKKKELQEFYGNLREARAKAIEGYVDSTKDTASFLEELIVKLNGDMTALMSSVPGKGISIGGKAMLAMQMARTMSDLKMKQHDVALDLDKLGIVENVLGLVSKIVIRVLQRHVPSEKLAISLEETRGLLEGVHDEVMEGT